MMALVKCTECKEEVSGSAEVCPHCGFKLKRPLGCLPVILVLFLGMTVFSVVSHKLKNPTKPAAPAERKVDVGATVVKMTAMRIKASMHNPKSFELAYAGANEDVSVVCIRYRGTNAFNAVVTNEMVILEEKALTGNKAWLKHCKTATMRDLTFVKRMLD